MNRIAKENTGQSCKPGKFLSGSGLCFLLFLGQTVPIIANPTDGTVVSGAATIGAAGQTLTINQTTSSAIINWQQFSIASGETTKFIVPTALSATLNRVTGGNPSQIYGTLQSNGVLYLVNPSGIVVGPNGRIDTAGFMGSTLDVSNQQFLAGGKLEFTGDSSAGIDNQGTIHASTGDVYLIANHVENKGAIDAVQGTVGLAAGNDVLFQQAGSQHLFVQATPAGTKRATGVTNTGTISAAAAELKAAGGNAYALAINNSGLIAATGFKKVNGQVILTSDGGNITNSGRISARTATGNGGTILVDGTASSGTKSGTVTNSGTLDASATVAKGHGGSVTLKSKNGGTAIHTGTILAKGGQGGVGGNAEISGTQLTFTGKVDLTAPGGQTGNLLLDPGTLNVVTGGTGSIITGQNDSTSTTIDPSAVESALGTANLTLNADTNVTVSNAIVWTSSNTLTLSTNNSGSSVDINAPISGINGGLVVNTSGTITTESGATLTTGQNITLNGGAVYMSGSFATSALNITTTTGPIDLEGVGTLSDEATASSLSLQSAGSVTVNNSSIQLFGGDFTATGTGDSFSADGVDILNSNINTDGGSYHLTGTAGFTSGQSSTSAGIGVLISNSDLITGNISNSGAEGSSSGDITINGTSDLGSEFASNSEMYGVHITHSVLSLIDGALSVTGNVSSGTSAGSVIGVGVDGQSVVSATGIGTLSFTGNTSGATSDAELDGFVVSGANLVTASGDITISGTGATTANLASALYGTKIANGSTVNAQDGAVSITGTVASGTATETVVGVDINQASTVTAGGTGGDITITGDTRGTTSGVNGGVAIHNRGTNVTASGTGGLTIIGHSGSVSAASVTYTDTSDNAIYQPTTAGIAVADGGMLTTTDSAPMSLTGFGGANNSSKGTDPTTGETSASYGVAVFSPLLGNPTSISSDGNLTINGTAGSSPTTGIGVVIGGPSNKDITSVTSVNGGITITGTGGSGNAENTGAVANSGVGIFNPGNIVTGNSASGGQASVNAEGGNLVVTGTAGSGGSTGVDMDVYFSSGNNDGYDGELTASGSVAVTSLAGGIQNDAGLNGTSISLTAPTGTNSNIQYNSDGASTPLSLTGGAFTISELFNATQYGTVNVTSLTINEGNDTPQDTNLGAVTTGDLTINTKGNVNIGGAIHANGAVIIQNTAGNITFGSGGSIVDNGEGNNVILAAGTNLPSSHYIINNSEAGANAIQVGSGSNFHLYSADPINDQFGGIAVTSGNTVFNATYITTGLPAANQELFYVASADAVGPNAPGGSGGSGGTGSGGAVSPPTSPLGGVDGSGSNIVPPAITPTQPPITLVSGNAALSGNIFQPPSFNYTGSGASSYLGQQDGGLANSSGNTGQVGSGDSAQLSGGQLNNVANPQASGALNVALGPLVYHNLEDALANLGDWADVGPSAPGADDTAAAGGGDNETIIGVNDVVEIGDNGVKKVPSGQEPQQLQNALNDDVRKGMNGGTGH